MGVITLNTKTRNSKAYVKEVLINIDTIGLPIREDSGKAILSLSETPLTGRQSERIDLATYVVKEDLDDIVALTPELFKATVTTRNRNTPSAGYVDLVFRADRIVGPVYESGSGSGFMYHENDGSNPVEYIVDESPSEIQAATSVQAQEAVSLYVAEVELSAAQIIAMNGAPVEVIGAPGAGKVIKIVDMTQILDYGTATFTGGGEVLLFDSNNEALTEAIPTESVTDTVDAIFVTGAVIMPHIAAPNSPIYITNDTAPFAIGDGVIRIKITYRVFNTEL